MRSLRPAAAALLVLSLGSCRGDPFDPLEYNTTWTEASHGASTPDYSVVFQQDSVNRIDIIMTGADWTAIRQNMIKVWGFDFGALTHTCCGPYPEEEPAYRDVVVKFNGKTWKHVGFRLKGNATLHYAWNAGIYKLPFRLKFDAWEDEFPETWNQRLYGFKDLAVSAHVFDDSAIRERLASNLFRSFGIPAARTASYRVYIDFGSGLEYNGVYTMIELPEDTMIQDQFGETSGNIYKPESNFGFFDATKFARQNHEESTDYSDVQSMIDALNNTTLQKSDPAQWRTNLEATFDVDRYLRWLAVNNAIVSWDTYGYLAHNFYIYNSASKKLTWIPWDQDIAFNDDPEVTEPTPRMNKALSLSMAEVDSYWPLIRYVADDPVYFARYKSYLKEFNAGDFAPAKIDALIDKFHAMVAPFVVAEQSKHTFYDVNDFSNFGGSGNYLKGFVASRRAKVAQFVK